MDEGQRKMARVKLNGVPSEQSLTEPEQLPQVAGGRVRSNRPIVIKFDPRWDEGFELYAKTWVRKNGWRVKRVIGGPEDQLQECAMIFCKLRDHYDTNNSWKKHKGEHNPSKHFMGLFKTALYYHWIALTRREQHTFGCDYRYRDELDEYCTRAIHPIAEIWCDVQRISPELDKVIQLLLNAPSGTFDDVGVDTESREKNLCWIAGVAHKPVFRELGKLISKKI